MFNDFFCPSWRWWQRNAAFYNLRSMSRCWPWEADAATTSEKKGLNAKFFWNTFFTHIPWARRLSGFERNSKADKKLRGIWCSQFDRPTLTIWHRTVKKWYFLGDFSTNMQYLGGVGGARTLKGSAWLGTSCTTRSNPPEWTWKMGQNLKN